MARLIGLKRISRVGNREKNGEGFQSESEQVDTCERGAEVNGHEVVLWIDETDSVSGKTMNREGVQEALRLIMEGFADGLIVAKYDRFSRDMIAGMLAINDLSKAGKIFIAVKDGINTEDTGNSGTGKMVLTLIAMMAEWYLDSVTRGWADVTRRRVKAGINTTEPYGYRKDIQINDDGKQVGTRKLLPVAAEAPWVVYMYEQRKEGKSWQEIADALNEQGVPTRSGKPWSLNTVSGIVHNPTYLGQVRSGELVEEDAHEAIIGPTLWLDANAKNQVNNRGEAMDYELTGIIRCSGCGVKMVGRTNKGPKRKDGTRAVYRYYDCRRKQNGFGGCPNPMRVRADIVEAEIDRFFRENFVNPCCVRQVEGVATGVDLEAAVLALEAAEGDLRAFINSETTAALAAEIGQGFVDEGIATRMARVKVARKSVSEARNAMLGVELPENLGDLWGTLSAKERHEFLDDAFSVIAAFPDNVISYWTVNDFNTPSDLPERGSGVTEITPIAMRKAPAGARVPASK